MINLLLSKYSEMTMSDNLKMALEITWKGLVAIFIVIGIIVAIVSVLNVVNERIMKRKKSKEENK